MKNEKSRRAEVKKSRKAEKRKGSYLDGFCPGGTDDNSPVIDHWEQESGALSGWGLSRRDG
jgi:hypothetical protein